MIDRNDFDKRFRQAQAEFDRDEKNWRRYEKIAICFTSVFFLLLFALMIAGIFWLIGNA